MSKLEKLLVELVIISYANLLHSTLLTRAVVAALAKLADSPQTYDKEIEGIDLLIDKYAKQLHEEMEDKPDGR